MALFLGAFAFYGLIVDLWQPHFDANLWWIDLRILPAVLRVILLAVGSLCLMAFAWQPPQSNWRRGLTLGALGVFAIAALGNAAFFYHLVARGAIESQFPVALSLVVFLALMVVVKSLWRPGAVVERQGYGTFICIGFLGCAGLFPLAQMACFGQTDYRRPADVVVVLGARAFANGRASDALADRVRTACNLYKQGIVPKLIFSGGPGDGAFHETDVMRAMAVQLGVRDEDILVDRNGVNTRATVKNTNEMLKTLRARRVLVVSHFYHLPRIKMAYQHAGQEVYTVPAEEPRILRQLPYNLVRETVAFWAYYFRPTSV